MAKSGVEEGASGASDGTFSPLPPRLARPIFSALKIAVLDFEASGFRVSGRRFFPCRPVSSPHKCQHADIAESCIDEGREKYSALYFFLVAGNEKGRGGRASVLSSARGLAEGQSHRMFLAHARRIACAAFERAMPTIYIGTEKSNSLSRLVPGNPSREKWSVRSSPQRAAFRIGTTLPPCFSMSR